jgi:hypothetical protein
MKRIFLGCLIGIISLQAFSTLIISNQSNRGYMSLKMINGPYRNRCLSRLLRNAYSVRGRPSRVIEDIELSAICQNTTQCSFQVYLGDGPACTGFVIGKFDLSNYNDVLIRSQEVPGYALTGQPGLITAYQY